MRAQEADLQEKACCGRCRVQINKLERVRDARDFVL